MPSTNEKQAARRSCGGIGLKIDDRGARHMTARRRGTADRAGPRSRSTMGLVSNQSLALPLRQQHFERARRRYEPRPNQSQCWNRRQIRLVESMGEQVRRDGRCRRPILMKNSQSRSASVNSADRRPMVGAAGRRPDHRHEHGRFGAGNIV